MKITNIRRQGSVDFTISGGKDGKVSVKSIRAGATDNVDLPADDPQVQNYLRTQQISIGADTAKAAAPAAKPAAS